jgi:hypothetical protein
MTDRTHIALEQEMQRRVDLIAGDLACSEAKVDIACIFDLGSSGGSNIARNKDSMIAEAFEFAHRNLRRG